MGAPLDTWNWLILLPVIAGGLAVWYLLPSPRVRPVAVGAMTGVIAFAGFGAFLVMGFGDAVPRSVEAGLFYGFAGLAIVFAFLMITARNPARSALAFALVVLSTCGLFLLLAAPFLTAATVVIYAGAIIVTFLFVIMLSQQGGPSDADLRSRDPDLAAAAGFVLLATLLVGVQRVHDWRTVDDAIEHMRMVADAESVDPLLLTPLPPGEDGMGQPGPLTPSAEVLVTEVREALKRARVAGGEAATSDVENALFSLETTGFRNRDVDEVRVSARKISDGLARLKSLRDGSASFDDVPRSPHGEVTPVGCGPKRLPAANVSAVGRALFSDHLLAIELAGTLLLVATAGAIAIAGRRREGPR